VAIKLLESLDAHDPLAHLTDDERQAEIHDWTDRVTSGRDKGIPWPHVLQRLAKMSPPVEIVAFLSVAQHAFADALSWYGELSQDGVPVLADSALQANRV
jgi:hypothetical protein